MDPDKETGLYFSLEDCKHLFCRLKKEETFLTDEELCILHRIEKVLYSNLSIREIEDLFD